MSNPIHYPAKHLMILALPWQRYDTTAIQLATIQATLQEDGYKVDTRHFYKDLIDYVPPDVYMRIFEAYMGEPCFAAILYPERHEQISAAVRAAVDFDLQLPTGPEILKHPQLNANLSYAERSQLKAAAGRTSRSYPRMLDFDWLVETLRRYLDDVFAAVSWKDYEVIAFTTSHQQLIPTVILSRRIKKEFPDKPIVIGGALMNRDIPEAVLRLYDEFDFIVSGEGESTIKELMATLTGRSKKPIREITGLFWRENGPDDTKILNSGPRAALEDLDVLPIPNYDDFFNHSLQPDASPIMPKLTVEASRACVWGKCVYCNLNLQWENRYRRKSHKRMLHELEHLRERYKSNIFTFCDTNVVDKVPLFEQIGHLPVDYRFLAEVSPHISRDGMRALRHGGIRTIQAGLESFSDRILKIFERGHTVMRNIEMLKWAAEFDIEIYYNLIINFPKEVPADVENALHAVEYAQHFMYPAIHDFSLTVNSPAYNNMPAYNIKGWRLPADIDAIYPPEVGSALAQMFALTVHPVPIHETGVSWEPLLEFADRWKRRYHANLGRPGIVYLDGGDFLSISIRSGGLGNDTCINVADEYREIYLACGDHALTLREICELLPKIPKNVISNILEELDSLKILFSSEGKHFSLGLRERYTGNYPVGEAVSKPERVLHDLEPASSRTRIITIRPPRDI